MLGNRNVTFTAMNPKTTRFSLALLEPTAPPAAPCQKLVGIKQGAAVRGGVGAPQHNIPPVNGWEPHGAAVRTGASGVRAGRTIPGWDEGGQKGGGGQGCLVITSAWSRVEEWRKPCAGKREGKAE